MPDALAEMVERRVAEGRYASHSDVIRDGLRALEARLEVHDVRIAAIRDDLQARLRGGFVSVEDGVWMRTVSAKAVLALRSSGGHRNCSHVGDVLWQ
jgi:putative addiction module CopG family antidote